MAKSKSSRRWLAEHFDDHWVKQAQQAGLRSRSAFKLTEIHIKDNLIRAGQCVVDLGSAPGGWCQVALPLIGDRGMLVGGISPRKKPYMNWRLHLVDAALIL
jgi:23S rRNA (uridine2552-2'-O)-methyltransferase